MAHDLRPASRSETNSCGASNGYIVHHVSKLDTLAGVAIKYGVEVADVKRLNGLVSDFEMFAHKSLRIPTGRRHPITSDSIEPLNSSLAHCYGNGAIFNTKQDAENNIEKRGRDQRSSSSAMNLLRGYYGLSSSAQQADTPDSRMKTSYKLKYDEHLDEELLCPSSGIFSSIGNGHGWSNGAYENGVNARCTSLSEANGKSPQLQLANTHGVCDVSNDRSVRRRFKSDAINRPSETCFNVEIKQDTSIICKLPLAEGLSGGTQSVGGLPLSFYKILDGALAGVKGKETPLAKVRKSSSTSNLQDQMSTHVNLSTQVEVIKSVSLSNQNSVKTSSDLPPKAISYRFKAAKD